MESKFVHSVSGQSVLQSDINLMADEAALADDRVLAELFRLAPNAGGGIAKAVIPYRVSGLYASTNQTIVRAGTGKVTVNPFRALIGSRTLVGAGALANWRDIRSAIVVNATTLATDVTLAACGAGVYRWDLIYAAVAIDANYVTASRKVKDGATGAVTTSSLVTQVKTVATVDKVTGVAAASPALPSLPADTASTFYVPLAYVRVPASFGGATALTAADIWEVSPQVTLSSATGASSVRVANGNNSATGAVQTRSPWTSTTRPKAYMPSTMAGCEELLVAVDLTTGSVSHNTTDVIDDSRDWSGRVWHVTAVGHATSNSPEFPWEGGAATFLVPGATTTSPAMPVHTTIGQTINAIGAGGEAYVVNMSPTELSALAGGTAVALYTKPGVDSALRIAYTGAPNCKLFFWLRASSAFANA